MLKTNQLYKILKPKTQEEINILLENRRKNMDQFLHEVFNNLTIKDNFYYSNLILIDNIPIIIFSINQKNNMLYLNLVLIYKMIYKFKIKFRDAKQFIYKWILNNTDFKNYTITNRTNNNINNKVIG